MKKYLSKWFFKDAKWWQFWMPQSGPLGGSILGFIVFVISLAIFK